MTHTGWYAAGIAVFLVAGVMGLYLGLGTASPTESNRVAAQLGQARRALENGAYMDVVRLAREIDDEQPEAAEIRLWEGVALWKLDRWQAAEEAWGRALRINPEVPEASWRLLLMFFYQQRFAEAEELALKLYPIEPDPGDRARLLLELIRQDSERVGPEATVKTLEPVLVNEPTNAHALRAVGLSYVQLGRINDGAQFIERACQLRPEDPESLYARVWYLFETGQAEKLGELWDRLPAAAWEQSRFWRYRGMWAESAGSPTLAEQAYRATLERDGADRKAHYQLARLLRAEGNDQEAEQHEMEASELDDAREALATAYLKTTQAGFALSSQDCREFARLCQRLARTRQARFWEQEAEQRASRSIENP